MTTYILHGGFVSREGESNTRMFQRLTELLPEKATLLIVFFASRHSAEEDAKAFRTYGELIQLSTARTSWSFVHASVEGFLDEVKEADCIIMRGGSTNKLIAALRAYNDLATAFHGKVVVGSSAGAYALARLGPSHDKDEVRNGLGLVPVRVVCHYESSELPPNSDAVKTLQKTESQLPLVLLGDGEWKEFPV